MYQASAVFDACLHTMHHATATVATATRGRGDAAVTLVMMMVVIEDATGLNALHVKHSGNAQNTLVITGD